MSWNHRILRSLVTLGGEEFTNFAMHEVYYEDGVPVSWTKDPVHVSGDTREEIKAFYDLMASAFEKPVLEVGPGEKLREVVDDTES